MSKFTSSIDSPAKKVLFSASKNDNINIEDIGDQENAVKNEIVSRRVLPRIVENFVVVWLDSNINGSDEDFRSSIAHLRCIVNSTKTFTVPDECVAFITDIKELKVFLILSEAFGEDFVPLIHDLTQLDSVYIFCDNEIKHGQWTKEWIKIKGIFRDISFICDQLKRNTRQCERDFSPFSIISSSSTTDLNELDPSFMYSKLLKEILLKMEHDDKAKTKLIEFCRIQYADNNAQLYLIDQFEREYNIHSPIWWYTKESFIYSMLNRALRTQDIEIIITMGCFLRDLHQQIEQLHSQANNAGTITVYRGQGLLNVEFTKMMKSKGGLLSFNSFLSTSTDRQVSLLFADSSRDDYNLTGILFQIEIDRFISSAPFAILANISNFSNEHEVLFSMHTIFRIGDMKPIENRLWQINLILTSDNDEQLTYLTKHMREEIEGETGWDRLGSLMIKMGEFFKAKDIYQTLVEKAVNDKLERRVFLQYELGRALYHTGDLMRSLSYLENVLNIREKQFPFNYSNLAITYRSIGTTHSSLGNYLTAISYYQKTLEVQIKYLSSDHKQLAKTYNNIGWEYCMLEDYANALSYCRKAVEIGQMSFPSNHPELSNIYDSIGRIYYLMRNYSDALSYYEKTLQIQQKSLQFNHPLLANSYSNIGEVYCSMGEYSTALSYYEKTRTIRQKSFASDHPDLAGIYNSIGEVYYLMAEHSTALFYYEKALEIRQKSLPFTHPHLANTYENIGLAHQALRDYSTALSFFEKTLENQQKSLPLNHPSLTTTHRNMTLALTSLNRHKEAVEHASRAVEIVGLSFDPSNREVPKC